MAWYDQDSLLTLAFAPNYGTILVTLLLAISLPIILHFFFYQASPRAGPPRFVLLGPSGSGKTALIGQLERGESSQTHTSISPITVEVTLPSTLAVASSKYRSHNDVQPATNILLADTPGHPKLRHMAIETLDSSKSKNLTALVFVVDSSAIGAEASSGELTETATYLHDTLLRLQKQHSQSKSNAKDIQFLVAANKMDLFTSLPEKVVKAKLEAEISKLRETKSKGIASVAQSTKAEGLNFGSAESEEEEEGEVLGGDASVQFKFEALQDYGINVSVLGGSVVEGEQGVDKWWEWIADLL